MGPQGDGRPLHMAGREKQGGVRRAGPGPSQGHVVLGTKATNVDTWGIWSNRHKGAWDPGFSPLEKGSTNMDGKKTGIDPVVLDQKHQSYLEFSV